MGIRHDRCILTVLATALLPELAHAEVVNFSWDNDFLTGKDRGYTNGVRLSYLTDSAEGADSSSGRFARVLRDELAPLPGIGSALLSSFRTSAKTGLVWQLGRHLPINFVPDYAGTSSTIALPGSFKDSGSSWSVYVGLGVEYVGYSYIDDNAGAYRFDEGPLIGQLGLGATWQWDHLLAAVTLRASTSEDERHKDNFSFGTLSVSWAI